jgi:hypothetical protein
MINGEKLRSVLRSSGLFCGGLWGAWVGAGSARLPDNADSFGTLFAHGFVFLAAVAGLFIGLALTAGIGRATEKALCRLVAPVAAAPSLAILVTGLALWRIAGFVPIAVPGIRSGERSGERGGPRPRIESPPPFREDPCRQPPPENPRERKRWEEECR